MFEFHTFVKRGLMNAINKQSNYWIMLNAAAYYEKGILTDADMVEIETLINSNLTAEEAQIADMTEALGMMEVEPVYESLD